MSLHYVMYERWSYDDQEDEIMKTADRIKYKILVYQLLYVTLILFSWLYFI